MKCGAYIEGRISNAGYYSDCVPTLVISVKKEAATGLPYEYGARVPITLVIGDRRYMAGTRCTEKTRDVKICADLLNMDGTPLRLADLLLANGFHSKQKIAIIVSDNEVTVSPLP